MKRALVLLPLLITLLALPGCGGSGAVDPERYLERISELHDEVALSLGETFAALGSLDLDDYYDLIEMKSVFEASRDIFASAERRAGEVTPPDEYRELHQDLLLFYGEGREDSVAKARAVSFMEEILLMFSDTENLALPDLPETASFEEIKSAAEEDLTTVVGYIEGLRGMDTPDDLLPLREKMEELLRSFEEGARTMEAEVTREDVGPFLRFRQEFPPFQQAADALWSEARSYLQGLNASVDGLLQRGMELAKRIPVPASPLKTGGGARGNTKTGGRA